MRLNRRIDRGRTKAPSLPWPSGKRPAFASRRICAGCGEADEQSRMGRITRIPGKDQLEWRNEGGRGTYLHAAQVCEDLFLHGRKSLPGLRLRPTSAARAALIAERSSIRSIAGKKD